MSYEVAPLPFQAHANYGFWSIDFATFEPNFKVKLERYHKLFLTTETGSVYAMVQKPVLSTLLYRNRLCLRHCTGKKDTLIEETPI